jgi:hypothetical protein
MSKVGKQVHEIKIKQPSRDESVFIARRVDEAPTPTDWVQ